MVDRIQKFEGPTLNRVQETDDRGGRRQQDQEEEDQKQKDKFDKKSDSWKTLVTDPRIQTRSVRAKLATGEKPKLNFDSEEETDESKVDHLDEMTETDELSKSVSRKFLVVAGVLDLSGKPKVSVILTYLGIAAVITLSTLLIFGLLTFNR